MPAATVPGMTRTLDRTAELLAQLEWHWNNQLRPRLDGLTDDEHRWERAQPSWNVRPRDPTGTAAQPGVEVALLRDLYRARTS